MILTWFGGLTWLNFTSSTSSGWWPYESPDPMMAMREKHQAVRFISANTIEEKIIKLQAWANAECTWIAWIYKSYIWLNNIKYAINMQV